ncbi:MAG: S24 family peptidase [Chloroflexota bacterium]
MGVFLSHHARATAKRLYPCLFKAAAPAGSAAKVNGRSMHPTLADGETVLVDTAKSTTTPHPRLAISSWPNTRNEPENKMIKRITAVTADSRYFLQGDNPDSLATTDSRSFGPVRPGQILGQITHRF